MSTLAGFLPHLIDVTVSQYRGLRLTRSQKKCLTYLKSSDYSSTIDRKGTTAMPPSKKPSKPAVNTAPLIPPDQEPVDMQKTLSRANRITMLDIGECMSESLRFNFDETTKDDINNAITVLKGLMSKESSRATNRTGQKYTTEVGTFTTRSYDIIVTAVVTRVE